jgi:hypothetical protein
LVYSLASVELLVSQVVVMGIAEPTRWYSSLAGLAGVSMAQTRADALGVAMRAARGAVETIPSYMPVVHSASQGWRSALDQLGQGTWNVIVFDRPTRWRDRRTLASWLRA